jgi:integrase
MEEQSMARQRWQNGSLRLENKHNPVWVLRYLEDYKQPDGQIKRVQKSVRIGTKAEFATERIARREARKYLDPINATTYKPKTRITFKEFTEKWERDVLIQFKPAGRASTKSNLRKLNESFASADLSAISTEMLQRWIGLQSALASKTVSNYLGTMQRIWRCAKSWGYVSGDSPFENLILPKPELKEQPSFTPEQTREIISRASEPYRTMFWLVAETGIRGGELCGLFVSDIDFENNVIFVRRSAYQGHLQTPKTDNAVRAFPISRALADHVLEFISTVNVQSSGPGERTKTQCAHTAPPLLFQTPAGKAFDNSDVVREGLKPILRAMGIDGYRVGLHALRHGNASAMDAMNAPMKVRQDRLGHGTAQQTMKYTHAASYDHRQVADALGALFAPTSSAGDGASQGTHMPGINEGIASASTGKPSESADSRKPVQSTRTETVQTFAAGAD